MTDHSSGHEPNLDTRARLHGCRLEQVARHVAQLDRGLGDDTARPHVARAQTVQREAQQLHGELEAQPQPLVDHDAERERNGAQHGRRPRAGLPEPARAQVAAHHGLAVDLGEAL